VPFFSNLTNLPWVANQRNSSPVLVASSMGNYLALFVTALPNMWVTVKGQEHEITEACEQFSWPSLMDGATFLQCQSYNSTLRDPFQLHRRHAKRNCKL
jgi:hypothetical protein